VTVPVGVTWETVPRPVLATQTLPLVSTVRPWGWEPAGRATGVNSASLVSTSPAVRLLRVALVVAADASEGGVNFTIRLFAASENHRVPSAEPTMPVGAGFAPPVGVGTAHSVWTPRGVIWAIWPAAFSVNQRLPSLVPRAMPWGMAAAVLSAKVVAAPTAVMRPMALVPWRVYQSAPSGPAAMPVGEVPWAAYSLMVLPSRVIAPIVAAACSVNHMRPSGPAVMAVGAQAALVRLTSTGTWVTAGMTPIWPAVWLVNQMLPSGPLAMPRGADCGARVTWVVWPTTAVTVRVAALLPTVPWLLVAISLNWARWSLTVVAARV